MNIRRVVVAVVLAVCLLPAASVALAHPPDSHRSIQFTTVSGYSLALSGTGWGHGRGLVVTFSRGAGGTAPVGAYARGVELRTASDGSFVVGVQSGNNPALCGLFSATVRDFFAHRKSVSTSVHPCPGIAVRPGSVTPSPVVLKGVRLKPKVVMVASSGPSSISMHLGDVLHLISGATPGTVMSPSVADDTYLALFASGVAGACTGNAACPVPSMYWEWVAIRKGTTTLRIAEPCPIACKSNPVVIVSVSIHV